MKLRARQRALKFVAAVLVICMALVGIGRWLKLDLHPPLGHPAAKSSHDYSFEAGQLKAAKARRDVALVKQLQHEARRDVAEETPNAQQRKPASEVETMETELKAANELVKQLQHEARSRGVGEETPSTQLASEVETMEAELKAANELVKQLQHEARSRDVGEETLTAPQRKPAAESLRRCDKWGRFPTNGPNLPSGTLRYRTTNSKETLTCTIEHMHLPLAVPTSVNAYYLYLGDHAYECGVLMAAWRIRKYDKVNDIIVGVPASYMIDVERFMEQVPNLRILQITEQTLPMVANGLWKETSYKFVALGLVQYRRVVFLDADSMVLRDLGHLFDIPCEVHFMAPVYHAGDTPGFTTAFFAATPSSGLYRDSMQHVTTYIHRVSIVCVRTLSHTLHAFSFDCAFSDCCCDTVDRQKRRCRHGIDERLLGP